MTAKTTIRGWGKAPLALMLVLLPLLGTMSQVQAQETGLVDDFTYVMALNGDVIEWEAPWEFSDDLNYVDDLSESVGFVQGAQFQSILYLPSGIDLEEARDSFIEGFTGDDVQLQTLDRGASSDVSYSLDLAQLNDILFGLFTVYIDDADYVRSYATLAPYSDLGDAVDEAAATITIDGDPIYNGVQGSGLQNLIDAGAGDFEPTDVVQGDGADESDDTGQGGTGDANSEEAAYVTNVRETYDELSTSVDDFKDYMANEDTRTADDESAMDDILDLWLDAPDNAADLEAPAGYEDVQEAYEDYAGTLADAADAYDNLVNAKAGTRKADRALGDLSDAFNDAETLGGDLDGLLTTAEEGLEGSTNAGNGGKTNVDDTDSGDESGDADAAAYLGTVQDNYDDLSAGVDRFLELFGSDEALTDADVQELNTILTSWLSAPDTAAALDVPAGYEDVQQSYEDYANALANASASFVTLLGAEKGSTEAEQAAEDFSTYLQAADAAGAELDDALTAAGA